jgi:dihydrofolate synthase/folylpolyglutamate synthase
MAARPPDAAPLAAWLAWIEQVLVRPPVRPGAAPPPEGMELGLERVAAVARRLGVVVPAPCSIIVAGTNGKGSTAMALEVLLRARGMRVGTTLSPHLVRFNERIRVDGRDAADADIVAAFAAIEAARRAGNREVLLTYFEFGILAALCCFRRAAVDVAVLEVGLGGRLDATNLVDADAAVVTAIGLDHQEYLGDDRESIGREKVAVARPGRPLIVGEPSPPRSVLDGAAAIGARLLRRGADFDLARTPAGFSFDMQGRRIDFTVQPRLSEEAVAAALATLRALGLEPTGAQVDAALRDAMLPGRLQALRAASGTAVVVDVAHNPHAARYIAARLGRHAGGRTHCLLAMLADKDAAGVAAALSGIVDCWHAAGTDGARGRSDVELASHLPPGASCHGALPDALDGVLVAAGPHDRVLVCGSFQAAAAALRRLGP